MWVFMNPSSCLPFLDEAEIQISASQSRSQKVAPDCTDFTDFEILQIVKRSSMREFIVDFKIIAIFTPLEAIGR